MSAQVTVDLDGHQAFDPRPQRRRQCASTGADLEDQILGCGLYAGRNVLQYAAVHEKVLTETPARSWQAAGRSSFVQPPTIPDRRN